MIQCIIFHTLQEAWALKPHVFQGAWCYTYQKHNLDASFSIIKQTKPPFLPRSEAISYTYSPIIIMKNWQLLKQLLHSVLLHFIDLRNATFWHCLQQSFFGTATAKVKTDRQDRAYFSSGCWA